MTLLFKINNTFIHLIKFNETNPTTSNQCAVSIEFTYPPQVFFFQIKTVLRRKFKNLKKFL